MSRFMEMIDKAADRNSASSKYVDLVRLVLDDKLMPSRNYLDYYDWVEYSDFFYDSFNSGRAFFRTYPSVSVSKVVFENRDGNGFIADAFFVEKGLLLVLLQRARNNGELTNELHLYPCV